jgi:hypothetical protein
VVSHAEERVDDAEEEVESVGVEIEGLKSGSDRTE